MKLKFYHPLWVHIPAVCLLATLVTNILLAQPLWQQHVITTHYATGIVSGTIPMLEAIMAMLVTALLFIGAAVAVDEDWARREPRKRFNWVSLLDEAVVGVLAALSVAYFNMQRTRTELDISWVLAAALGGTGVVLALLCEWLRPWNPVPDLTRYEIETPVEDIPIHIAAGHRWIYRERQHAKWYSAAIIAFSILMLAIVYDNMMIALSDGHWDNLTLIWTCGALAVAIFLLWGGLGVSVTREFVCVSLGLVGIRLFRLRVADICRGRYP